MASTSPLSSPVSSIASPSPVKSSPPVSEYDGNTPSNSDGEEEEDEEEEEIDEEEKPSNSTTRSARPHMRLAKLVKSNSSPYEDGAQSASDDAASRTITRKRKRISSPQKTTTPDSLPVYSIIDAHDGTLKRSLIWKIPFTGKNRENVQRILNTQPAPLSSSTGATRAALPNVFAALETSLQASLERTKKAEAEVERLKLALLEKDERLSAMHAALARFKQRASGEDKLLSMLLDDYDEKVEELETALEEKDATIEKMPAELDLPAATHEQNNMLEGGSDRL